jgi:MtN3 and saliva related transmembrane protein
MSSPLDPSWSALVPTTWLGYAAAVCTTAAFVPQALLTLRTRDVSGISLGMYGAFTFGILLWLWYGWRLSQWPLILANAVTLALALTILGTKLAVMRRDRRRPAP